MYHCGSTFSFCLVNLFNWILCPTFSNFEFICDSAKKDVESTTTSAAVLKEELA